MRKSDVSYAKTKTQISSAVSAQLKKFKLLAFYCERTVRFVSDLVGNPEDRFSCDEAQII